jgi:hypothetical protein
MLSSLIQNNVQNRASELENTQRTDRSRLALHSAVETAGKVIWVTVMLCYNAVSLYPENAHDLTK